jgi:hypothetical protein
MQGIEKPISRVSPRKRVSLAINGLPLIDALRARPKLAAEKIFVHREINSCNAQRCAYFQDMQTNLLANLAETEARLAAVTADLDNAPNSRMGTQWWNDRIAEKQNLLATFDRQKLALLVEERAKVQRIIDQLSEYLLSIPLEVRGEMIRNDGAARDRFEAIDIHLATLEKITAKIAAATKAQAPAPQKAAQSAPAAPMSKEEELSKLQALRAMGGHSGEETYRMIRALPKAEYETLAKLCRCRTRKALAETARRFWENTGRQTSKASALPEWPQIEQAARALAAARIDQTVSFEELAKALNVTPLYVKTAVYQQMRGPGGIQLVRGEAREMADPSTGGLESGGDVYFRFRFMESFQIAA